jgi:hypothetical protein
MLMNVSDYQADLADTSAEKRQPEGPAPLKKQDHRDEREVWLLGQPTLARYLDFVAKTVVDGEDADRAELTSEWCVANDYYQELERTEAGIANQVACLPLNPSLEILAAQVKAHPQYRRAFDTLPTRFGMVELDKLIVCQKHVTLDFIEALKARLGGTPDLAALFRFCNPIESAGAPVEIRRVGSHRYVFRCESTDFRFQESKLLRHDQVADYESVGPLAGIVGLAVGFGSNFLNAVSVGKRILLNNGHHRACALRAMGITHAPCVIRTATRGDEVAISVKSSVAEDAEFYFESARPPLLKDFFDPNIRKVLPTRRVVRQIEVSFEVKEYFVCE